MEEIKENVVNPIEWKSPIKVNDIVDCRWRSNLIVLASLVYFFSISKF